MREFACFNETVSYVTKPRRSRWRFMTNVHVVLFLPSFCCFFSFWTAPCRSEGACMFQWNCELCRPELLLLVGPTKSKRSRWRLLTNIVLFIFAFLSIPSFLCFISCNFSSTILPSVFVATWSFCVDFPWLHSLPTVKISQYVSSGRVHLFWVQNHALYENLVARPSLTPFDQAVNRSVKEGRKWCLTSSRHTQVILRQRPKKGQ
jgi:hypothetical protein